MVAEEAWFAIGQIVGNVRPDDSAVVDGVFDVLDPDWNRGFDDLLHCKRVNHLRAVEGQFGCFGRCDRVQQSRGRHFARVCGEDAVDFFPDLQLVCAQTDRDQGGAEIGVAPSDLVQESSRYVAKVAGDDGHHILVLEHLFGECGRKLLVEAIVESLADIKSDDLAHVDKDRIHSLVLEQTGHVHA